MNIMARLMPSCREVSDLVLDRSLDRAPWHQRMLIRMHLGMCEHCARFARQIELVAAALRELWTDNPTPERLKELKRHIIARLS